MSLPFWLLSPWASLSVSSTSNCCIDMCQALCQEPYGDNKSILHTDCYGQETFFLLFPGLLFNCSFFCLCPSPFHAHAALVRFSRLLLGLAGWPSSWARGRVTPASGASHLVPRGSHQHSTWKRGGLYSGTIQGSMYSDAGYSPYG